MNKKALFFAIIFTAGAAVANAQSIVDPGVSVHNYKHPNKAAQAKKSQKANKSVAVYNLNTVEAYSKQQYRNRSTTPKYAPRPATLVVTKRYNVEGIEINPLLSPRNYKTPTNSGSSNNTQVANYYNSADSSVYPTVD